jgi:4-amino-4-deoxy-L-arabinose transferase-like glycosyltransferase
MNSGRRAVLVVALATFGFHLAFASRYGWFRDELYYVACARRLAWGYVDHPPVVAAIARVAWMLFGESLVGLRAFAALSAAGMTILAGETARVMGGGRFAQVLSAVVIVVGPFDLVIGHLFTMNCF